VGHKAWGGLPYILKSFEQKNCLVEKHEFRGGKTLQKVPVLGRKGGTSPY
jgi:hypothetical protein